MAALASTNSSHASFLLFMEEELETLEKKPKETYSEVLKLTQWEIVEDSQIRFVCHLGEATPQIELKKFQTAEKVQSYALYLLNYTPAKLVRRFTGPYTLTKRLVETYKGLKIFHFSQINDLESFTLHWQILNLAEGSGFDLKKNQSTDLLKSIAYEYETANKDDLDEKLKSFSSKVEHIYAAKE